MRHSLLLTGLLVLGVARPLGAQAAAAPAPAAAQPSGIVGFLSLPWGAKATDVTAAYQKPMMDQTTADSSHVMVYRDEILGKPVLAMFYVDPRKGLVKGAYSVPYDALGSDCDLVFEKFGMFVRRLYPSLRGTEEKKQDLKGIPFCAAADSGKASRSAVWEDPAGNSVHLTLDPSANHVDVEFQSKDFRLSKK